MNWTHSTYFFHTTDKMLKALSSSAARRDYRDSSRTIEKSRLKSVSNRKKSPLILPKKDKIPFLSNSGWSDLKVFISRLQFFLLR